MDVGQEPESYRCRAAHNDSAAAGQNINLYHSVPVVVQPSDWLPL